MRELRNHRELEKKGRVKNFSKIQDLIKGRPPKSFGLWTFCHCIRLLISKNKLFRPYLKKFITFGRVHRYPFLIFLWFSTITVKFYTLKRHKIPISDRSNCLYFMGKVDEATWHWSNYITVWNDFAIISMFCGVSLYTKLASSRRRTPIYLLLSAWKALWIVNII